MMSTEDTLIETVILIAYCVMAMIILGSNLAIAFIFLRKDKKFASDYLIITGLLGDGVYGLMFLSFPFVIKILTLICPNKFEFGICFMISYLFLDSALTLFSLLLIFCMTLNRYIAVVKPFKYKYYFKKRTVIAIITSVSVVCCSIFVISSGFLFLIYFKNRRLVHDNMDHMLRKYIVFWPLVQFSIVLIDSCLIVYVYVSIAIHYNPSRTNFCCIFPQKTEAEVSTDSKMISWESSKDYQGLQSRFCIVFFSKKIVT